jgi:hypothetical protein
MTRKDFEMVASGFFRALREADDMEPAERLAARTGLSYAANNIANSCFDANPRFDRQRFMTACGF